MQKMSKCRWATVACLGMATAAFGATSPTIAIRAVAEGRNLDWGQVRAATVPLNWTWPDGARSAVLKIVANGRKAAVLKQTFSDTSVTSYAWNMGAPSADTVYDATLTFDSGEVQTAQLYANPGAFGGVPLKGWDADGKATLPGGRAIPYCAAWGEGLAGTATFKLGEDATELPFSDGYLCVPRRRGTYAATLDFAVEPSSPAFTATLDVWGPGLMWVIR